MTPVTRSPLRYPGGKAKLFPFVAGIIHRSNLFDCDYKEPYAGGAGLALNLLFSGFCRSITLNDVDPAIHSFWWCAVHRGEEFRERVRNITFSIDEWHAQRDIWKFGGNGSIMDLGFATYYLNRTNRSGIIDGAGPIGGYGQRGTYKMDARFTLHDQLTILKMIGDASAFIEVSCKDAVDFLSNDINPDNDLVYLDPPYYVKGQRLYRNFYDHGDHVVISSLMKSRPGNWIVSYDDVPEIRAIYDWSNPISIVLQYSAGPVTLGKEVVYLSDNLRPHVVADIAA